MRVGTAPDRTSGRTPHRSPDGAARERRPGRPRDEDLETRAIAATLALVDAGEPITLNRVVSASGVSRAAIYRRWPTLTALLAAALDEGREPTRLPDRGSLRSRLIAGYLDSAERVGETVYPAARLRRRLALGLADRALQRAYWDGHAGRRREPIAALLREGVRTGELRADLDVEATIDLFNGVFYYQWVVRGVNPSEPDARARCATALDIAWRGIQAQPGSIGGLV